MTFYDLVRDTCAYYHLDPSEYILKDGNKKIWSNYLKVREEMMMETNSKFYLEYKQGDKARL